MKSIHELFKEMAEAVKILFPGATSSEQLTATITLVGHVLQDKSNQVEL